MKSDNSKKPVKKAAIGSAESSAKAPTRKLPPRQPPLEIPSILLEGDASAPTPVSGPGQRYALRPAPPGEVAGKGPESGELPEAYGTQRLLLTARDPHWVYAHWDFTRDQLRKYNALSADRHLVLRVHKDAVSAQPWQEIHVHPESRNWFVNVGVGGAKYMAELGYYQRNGHWVNLCTSSATVTPPDSMSDDVSVWFETLPMDLQFDQLVRLVRRAVRENVPLIEAIQQLRAAGFRGLPDSKSLRASKWTAEQERALAEIITMDAVRRIWMGSLEITELIRRHLAQELWSAAAAQIPKAELWSGAISSITSVSSPFGGPERRRGFWFNVNAELIIYGATEPSATVTIGGRKIKLRPDGSFSYRFALPDGNYDLPAIATSADGEDSRSAELKFSRATQYRGEVGKHPQDPKLKPPLAENVA